MITFSSIKNLCKILDLLLIPSTKEEGTASNCVKIEQVATKLTRFTTYEPKIGYYTRDLLEVDANCLGHVGDEYLVDYEGFTNLVKRFEKTGCQQLTIDTEEGMLYLYVDYRINLYGDKEYKTKQRINLYSGDSSDFNPPEFDNTKTLLGYIPSDNLNTISKLVIEASNIDYKNKDKVLLNLDYDKLKLYSESQDKSVWYEICKPASFTNNKNYIIESKNLLKILNLVPEYINGSDAISIYSVYNKELLDPQDPTQFSLEEWLLFESKYSNIYIQTISTDYLIENNNKLFNQFRKEQTFVIRECSPFGLFNSFTNMHDKSREAYEYLLLLESVDEDNIKPPKFVIKDCEDIIAPVDSWCDIFYSDNTEFYPLAFRYKQISTFLNVIKKYYELEKSLPTTKIELKLSVLNRVDKNNNTHTIYLLYSNYVGLEELSVHCQPTDPNLLGVFNFLQEVENEVIDNVDMLELVA
jgi:hypothetical protein